MCGICGKFSLKEEVDPSLVSGMCSVLAHRGPDDQGIYTGSFVGLGHRRLSIIDLSPAAHQPMSTADGELWITYNGEVYNFRELREELRSHGYFFRSNCDTEVVLYSYREWGADCLRRLNGIFAFAIWDEREQRLFIARDRFGVKPLYYHIDEHWMVFASEIKAILQDEHVSRELSPKGILNYLTYGHSVAPNTIFKDVRKLLPGHHLTCSLDENDTMRTEIKRYWTPPLHSQCDDAGEPYYAERVRSLLTEAVRKQLVSDVPLGVFLSGGLDSSIVTALMSSLHGNDVKTFSIGFSAGGKAYNELDDARLVARHFGTEHHELVLNENDLLDSLPELIYHYDEPFGDSASFPTYLLSRFAREQITVALSGEGGDEVFGGYRRYALENMLTDHRAAFKLFNRGPARAWVAKLAGPTRRDRLLGILDAGDDGERYGNWLNVFNKDMLAELLDGNDGWQLDEFDPSAMYRGLVDCSKDAGVNRLLCADQQTWLPDTYLEKVDKASMAVGLEVRVPILDHELVEFMATVPARYKVKGFTTKVMLKKAFGSVLPPEILHKPKHGFAVPLDPWIVNKLGTFVSDVLFDTRTRSRGFFDQRYIETLYRQHAEGKGHFHRHLWLLIVFELWCRRFLDSDRTVSEVSHG